MALAMIRGVPMQHPFKFQLVLATFKTWAADYIVQTQVERCEHVDWKRSAVFACFGALYSGGFQYVVFVKGFARWFPHAVPFTKLSLAEKLRHRAGQLDLVKQIAGHAFMSTVCYLPIYYTIKEVIAGDQGQGQLERRGGVDVKGVGQEGRRSVTTVVSSAMVKYRSNFWEDNIVIQGFWMPMDIILFGLLPMWARMPAQHTSALAWTMILSLMRGSTEEPTQPPGSDAA